MKKSSSKVLNLPKAISVNGPLGYALQDQKHVLPVNHVSGYSKSGKKK